MNDQRHVLAGSLTILSRKEVTLDHFDLRALWTTVRHIFDSRKLSGRPGKADNIAKPTIEQTLNDPRTDETGGTSHENWIVS
jgi:hypothetical protein